MTPGWWNGRLCAFDLETTAADPEQARIVTAAIAHVGGGQATETLTLLADPGVEIPVEATAVHGITTERARAEGRHPQEVIAEILLALGRRPESAPLVIFNARYDLTVLDRELRRWGMPPLGEREPLLVVDPFVIDKHLDRYRRGSRKLEAVCAHYGATLDGAHDAAHDAIAAARVAWCIGKRGQVVRQARGPRERDELAALEAEWSRVHNDLAALHDAQARWAAEQAAGLANYFRSQGKADEADGVRGEWPLVPWGGAAREAA